jgi:hypothetical protein
MTGKYPGYRTMTATQRIAARRNAYFAEQRTQENVIAQGERASTPGYDPTCIFCVNGEEPGHEH